MDTNTAPAPGACRASGDPDRIEFYEHAIPGFAAQALDACYGALFSSLAYLRLSGRLGPATCTYVAYAGGAVRSIFLFEREGDLARVLNAAIRTEPDEVRRFADYLFGRLPGVRRIAFPGVHMGRLRLAYPCQRFLAGEDIVISFAGTAEEYAARLGRSTRKILRRHAAALGARHPGAGYRLVPGAAQEGLVERIADWNRQHMAARDRVSAYGERDVRQVAALAAGAGMVGTVVAGTRVRAGTVCCRVGCSIYLLMTGFDGEYGEFGLGMLCNYWTVMECLRMQCRDINLMGGRLPYKYSLLGRVRAFDSLAIYRSRGALLRHGGEALRTALRGHARQARFALLECERKDGMAARLVARALDAWRAAKRSWRGLGSTRR